MVDIEPDRRTEIPSERKAFSGSLVVRPDVPRHARRGFLVTSAAGSAGALFLDSPTPSHAQSAADLRFTQHDAIFQRVKPSFQKWRPSDINHPDSARAFNPDRPIWVRGGAYGMADEVHYRLTGQSSQARQYEEWMAKRLLYQYPGTKEFTGKCFAYNNYLFHILNSKEVLPWRRETESVLGIPVVDYQRVVDLEAVGQHGADASIRQSPYAEENINLFCANTQQTGEEFIVMTQNPPGFIGLWFALIRRFINGSNYSSVIAGKEVTISRNHMKGYAYQPLYLTTRADAARIEAALEPEEQRSPFLDHDEIRLITRGVELPPGWNVRYPLFWDDNLTEYAEYMKRFINSGGRDNPYQVGFDVLEVPTRPQDY